MVKSGEYVFWRHQHPAQPQKTWRGGLAGLLSSTFPLPTQASARGYWPSSFPASRSLSERMWQRLCCFTRCVLFYTLSRPRRLSLKNTRWARPRWPEAADCKAEGARVLPPDVLSSFPFRDWTVFLAYGWRGGNFNCPCPIRIQS